VDGMDGMDGVDADATPVGTTMSGNKDGAL